MFSLSVLVVVQVQVVLGRPTVAELDPEVVRLLREVTEPDNAIYVHAQMLLDKFIVQHSAFQQVFSRFRQMQSSVDQSCKFAQTNSSVNIGLDCYNMR